MLLSDLKSGGEKVAAGEFVLDEDRAREKLAEFQLVDPRRCVLEFVKAAHLLGATKIEFQIDANEIEVRFDGETVTRAEFDNLASAVFARRTTSRQRALRHLAIGHSAAQGLGLSHFEYSVIEADRPIMRVYLKQRARPSLAIAFASHLLFNRLAEEKILREHCEFATIPIFVNGTLITRPFTLPEDVRTSVSIAHPTEQGVLGMPPPRGFPGYVRIQWRQHGVKVAESTHPSPLGDATIFLDSSRLTLNLSQSDVVQDEVWSDILERIIPDAHLRCLRAYLLGLSPEAVHRQRKTIFQTMIHLSDAFGSPGNHTPMLATSLQSFMDAAATLKIFELANPTADEEGKDFSIDDVRWKNPANGKTRFYIARRSAHGIALRDRGRALYYAEVGGRVGRTFLPYAEEVFDATDLLEEGRVRLENKKKWRNTPWFGGLFKAKYGPQLQEVVEGLKVSVGMFTPAQPIFYAPRAYLVKDGHVLTHNTWPHHDGMQGLTLLIEGDIEPNDTFDGPASTAAYLAAATRAAQMIPVLLLKHVRWATLDEQCRIVGLCLDRPTARGMSRSLFGLEDGAQEIGDALINGVISQVTEDLGRMSRDQIQRQQKGLQTFVGDVVLRLQRMFNAGELPEGCGYDDLLEVVATMPIFEVANPDPENPNRYHSIADLRWTPTRTGKSRLYITTRRAEGIELDDGGRALLFDLGWGRSGGAFNAFAEQVFDATALLEARLDTAQNKQQWQRRADWSPDRFYSRYPDRLEYDVSDIKVIVGLGSAQRPGHELIVVSEGRVLKETTFELPGLMDIGIVIEGNLLVNQTFDGPAHTPRYLEATRKAVEGIAQISLRRCRRLPQEQRVLRSLLDEGTRATLDEAFGPDETRCLRDATLHRIAAELSSADGLDVPPKRDTIRDFVVLVLGALASQAGLPTERSPALETFFEAVASLPLFEVANASRPQSDSVLIDSVLIDTVSISELRWTPSHTEKSRLYITSGFFPGAELKDGGRVLRFDEDRGERGWMFLRFAEQVFDATALLEESLQGAKDQASEEPEEAAMPAPTCTRREEDLAAAISDRLQDISTGYPQVRVHFTTLDPQKICQPHLPLTIELNRGHPVVMYALERDDTASFALLSSAIISRLVHWDGIGDDLFGFQQRGAHERFAGSLLAQLHDEKNP
ncbi:MAG: hypothetical protein ACNA8W_05730 [Bradymonadaceae bacterium]